jgi:hypothetical protein
MRYVKRYAEGGKLPPGKLGDLMHALKYYSSPKGEQYDTSTLLDMLSFTKGGEKVIEQKEKEEEDREIAERASMFGGETAPLSSPESQPEFSSFREGKKGNIRISEYFKGSDEEEGGYGPDVAPMSLKDPQLNKLSGRLLKSSEQSRFRELLNDPSLLKYFMDMRNKGDMDFIDKKLGKVRASRGGGADKATRNPCPGGICRSSAYD